MRNKFLKLPKQTRINAFNQIAEKKGITPFTVEKDWWVTQTLFAVFQLDMASHIIFKGGTSLSKSWGLIQRFSEDIDLAIDREFLGFSEIPKKKTNLRKKSAKFVAEEFYPKLKAKFSEIGISEGISFELEEVQSSDQDPRIIHIFYPSIVETKGYINPKVQIEIGCRSLKEPFTQGKISSFVDEMYRHLDFTEDSFLVPSVNPERTFLEKIFLLHEEFQKPKEKMRVDRLSRHLYDLYSLYHSEYKEKALIDRDLYRTIVKHREEFTKVAGINYSLHSPKTVNFLPPKDVFKDWEKDYEVMKSEMLYSENRPSFDEIIASLERLKQEINNLKLEF